MKKIVLSVIIPVYNAELFLPRCLDSVFGQTLSELEVVCVNDGSTDGSLSVLRGYQREHDNLVVLDQKNGGPSAARNAGIAAAQGEYIAFVDSDDYIEPEMYGEMVSAAREHGLDVVMCSYINDYAQAPSAVAPFSLPGDRVLEKEEIRSRICPELMKDGIFNGPCNKIYRRAFLDRLDTKMPEDLRYGEDLIFQLEIFDKLDRTYFIDRPFYHYVHRENSLSGARGNMLESTLIPMYRIRRKYGAKWGLPEEKTAEYFVYYGLMDLVNSLRGLPIKEKLRKLRRYLTAPELCQGLRISRILSGPYTVKIKLLYGFCRMFCRKNR